MKLLKSLTKLIPSRSTNKVEVIPVSQPLPLEILTDANSELTEIFVNPGRPTSLKLPVSSSTEDLCSVDASNPIVFLGANGAGKTRLGYWLEFKSPQYELVHRVSAQRILTFPDSVSPIPVEDAKLQLSLGTIVSRYNDIASISLSERGAHLSAKTVHRWSKEPEVGALSDFGALMVFLASDEYNIAVDYHKHAQDSQARLEPPLTVIDRVRNIWEQILPHRKLVLNAGSVKVKSSETDTENYKAAQMSDGERVTFYLLGQCLAAPENSIIVVDEPEIHLHKAIQSSLWDAIEKARPDCLFVYLTHDLDFSATRSLAKKLWIKSFDGANSWEWQEVPESEQLPEEVLLTILGSRKPILFTEGTRGGTEQVLFSRIYPGWTIMPQGSCEQVIQATKAFTALNSLHGLNCQGIIDLDYRTPEEVATLATSGIHVLGIQEIENLLLVEPVLQLVAAHTHMQGIAADTSTDIISKVKDFVFGALSREQEQLTSRRTAWELEKQLRKVDRSAVGVAALEQARDTTAQFDVAATYAAINQEIEQVIATRDYAGLLRLYNNKGLAKQIGRFFGIQSSYPDFVKRLISNGSREDIIQALRDASPVLA